MAFAQFNQELIGYRPGKGAYANGIWVPGGASFISLLTSVQPAGESDLKLLPEGRREARAYTLYSRNLIAEEDIYLIQGEPYEVLRVGVWQNKVIPHYKAIASRMDQMLDKPLGLSSASFGELTAEGVAL